MNAKLTILILVAMIAAVLVPVSAENVYVDRNPAKFDVLPPDAHGYVVFYIRAGGSAQDLNIWIGNDANKNATFDPSYHPDKTVIEGQNPHFMKVKVLPDGVSEPVQLAAGNYTAYLQKGNGDQLEQFQFKIGGGATERVQFLGAAVTCDEGKTCKVKYKVLKALYGSTDCEIIHHEAITHKEFVIDGKYKVTCSVRVWEWGHGWVTYVKCTNPEHDGWHKQIPECTETYGHYETVIDTPAWDESVCNEMVDVTAALNGVIAGGNLQFVFDNSQNPGGIFADDGTTLLSPISDPAYGFVKMATITYTDGCGLEKTIGASEGTPIDLVTG